jgi:arginine exporter protein ArgO
MEGITILNQTIHEGSIIEPLFTIGTVSIVCGAILFFLWGVFVCSKAPEWLTTSTVCLAVLGMIFATFIGVFAPHEQITRYQVIIDESVSLTEFNEHYRIIEQNGLIYTIEEREP